MGSEQRVRAPASRATSPRVCTLVCDPITTRPARWHGQAQLKGLEHRASKLQRYDLPPCLSHSFLTDCQTWLLA